MISYRHLWTTVIAALVAATSSMADTSPGLQTEPPESGRSVQTDQGYMVAYEQRIPGTDIVFEMVPIPAGKVTLGSPDSEAQRQNDEGPQVEVEVDAFWMGKCEVTWAEYQTYMRLYDAFKIFNDIRSDPEKLEALPAINKFVAEESIEVDGVTSPTPLYDPSFTYYPGEEPDQPAVTMTQYAARQYTKWLSGITGHDYRLPSEAEWEYAARSGTTTAYSFGDDDSQLGEYAWFAENSDDETHSVGTKKPNAWGLYDMHGNAAEWVLDGYEENGYASLAKSGGRVSWPEKVYPRVIRGGCWFDNPGLCRSAARHKSDDPNWTLSDPNIPRSPWWFTEDPATGVGFRIVRPLHAMDDELRKKVWNPSNDWIEQDLADRLDEGRGAIGGANPLLPQAVQELQEAGLIE